MKAVAGYYRVSQARDGMKAPTRSSRPRSSSSTPSASSVATTRSLTWRAGPVVRLTLSNSRLNGRSNARNGSRKV